MIPYYADIFEIIRMNSVSYIVSKHKNANLNQVIKDGQAQNDEIYKNERGNLRTLILMRLAVNAMWIANSVVILVLLCYQRDQNGNYVDCFAVDGIARPYMIKTSNDFYKKQYLITDERRNKNPNSPDRNPLTEDPEYRKMINDDHFVLSRNSHVFNYSLFMEILIFISTVNHLFLIFRDLGVLFNDKKYDQGNAIGSKLKKRACCRIIFYLQTFFIYLTLFEPIIIILESLQVLGFEGSLCSGLY